MTGALPARGRMHRDPLDTERAAAESIAPDIKTMQAKVLRILRDHTEGLTDDEGARLLNFRTGLPYVDRLTFGRRRQELCTAGLVEGTDERRVTPRGRTAIVWRAVAEGEA